jgi:PAS domain S-box-containing protein
VIAAPRTRPLVLLVDDEAAIRLVATAALEASGFDVVEAEDGPQALARFAEQRPELVLLDVLMPGMDGYAVCRALRATPLGAQTPVLIMTGLEDVESIDRAYEVGATDFVTKPINPGLIGHRVRYVLRAARAIEEATDSERRLSHAQRVARLANWELALEGERLHLSREMHEIFGLPPAPAEQGLEALLRWVHPDERRRVDDTFAAALRDRAACRIEYRMILPDGGERIVTQDTEFVRDGRTGGLVLVGTMQDITALREAERQILRLAYYDGLTGLPNRTFLREQLVRMLAEAKRYRHRLAILALDLDLLKRINDTLGHAAGDELLREAARRMSRALRESDTLGREVDGPPGVLGAPDGETVARIGGDEFVAVLTHVRSPEDAALVARRITKAFTRPFVLDRLEVFVGASIGIASYPEDGEDVETLLRHADLAMHEAKERGRNSFQFYAHSMNDRAHRRIALENGLRTALERNEFVLHYQPRLQLAERRADSVEALVRWKHPENGMISPADFIPVAEDTGLIVPLGEWVLRTACLQARAWSAAGAPIRVAVNISARQFREPDLAASIGRILDETGVDPALLEVEITEGVVMQDTHASSAVLSALRKVGVRVALDDFGTGYSSLSYLTRFPIDILKIDRSFVQGVISSKTGATITAAIIALSRSLGLEVVAEGIETEEQLAFLKEHGCGAGQGFLFARPLPVAELEAWLKAQPGRP